ncbi:MAG: hypothetical protein ACTSR3_04745 [Candidatus Helarchaeota archaeon]
MRKKQIFALLVLFHLSLPFFFITPLISSQNIAIPPPQFEINNPSTYSTDVDSPYYQEYINNYNWEFDTSYAPLQILTIVHYEENSNFDDFSMLASIPFAIFNDSGVRKISPIIYDNIIDNENTMEFIYQWKAYNDYFGGLKRIIYIGDVSDQVKNKMTAVFGAPSEYRPPLNFSASNIYDLSASIANYFWFTNDKVIIAQAQNIIQEFESITDLTPITGIVNKKEMKNIIDNINSTIFNKFYDFNNISINGGAILVEINDTMNNLRLQLIGNYSNPSNQWIFDTTNYTNNNWVFHPNVTHPANISDWCIQVFNSSEVSSDIFYNLTFYNFTSNFQNFRVNYSNCKLKFQINTTDAKIWLLDPNGQFFTASNSSGEISIKYPSLGDWTLIISGNETHNTPYEISINIANYSSEKETLIESATNGAVIASLSHAPLLYTDGNSLTTAVRNELTKLDPAEAIIINLGKNINETLFTELGISVKSLENMSIIMDYIENLSYKKDIILTSLNAGFFAPAGIMAAYHGGSVLPVFNETHNFYGKALSNYKLMENSYYQSPLQNGPFYDDMVNLSNIYHDWINNFDSSTDNRTVLIISPLNDLNPIFDRAIMGKSITGRFPGENEIETLIFICRNIFYRALTFKNITEDSEVIYREIYQSFNCKGVDIGNLKGTDFTNYSYTFQNDSYYHIIGNETTGQYGEIQVPYYIQLSDHNIIFENITKVKVSLIAQTDYQNSSIEYAGWKIFNWTSQTLVTLSENIFNSSTDQLDTCLITLNNKTHFINSSLNNRIDIYFYINTTGPTINASVNYIAFNTSFWVPFAKQEVLMSSISYWHNISISSQVYNFSDEIPNSFKNMDYKVIKGTGFNEITNTLLNKMAIWYQCGFGNYTTDPFEDLGFMEFLQNNYSRGFNPGGSEQDPIGSLGNPIDPANKLWRDATDISNIFPNKSVNLSIIILNDDYLASTQIPLSYLRKGSACVIANLRKNTLGYSEYLFYISLNEMINRTSIGSSLIKGFQSVSNLYSFNYQANIVENPPFADNTEDSHQFIILGDPDLILVNSSSKLILPGNYRPLVLNVLNQTTRTGNWNYNPDTTYPNLFEPTVYVNATDIDSDEYNPDFVVGAKFYKNEIEFLATYFFDYLTTPTEDFNFKIKESPSYGDRIFSYNDTDAPLNNDGIKIEWFIFDGTDNQTTNSYLTLISCPPIFWQYYNPGKNELSKFYINNGTYSQFLDYETQNEIGRINQTLLAEIVVGDPDFDRDVAGNPENVQTEVILCMNYTTQEENHWINITLELNETIEQFNDPSLNDINEESDEIYGRCSWSGNYTFTAYDPVGKYDFWIFTKDMLHNNVSNFAKVNFVPSVEIIDWDAQIENFSNNTNELFRVNETLTVNAKFFDVDDYHDPNNISLPLYTNDSVLLHCEENSSLSLTNLEINGTEFENDYQQTFYNDSLYHTMVNNSDGNIFIPYAINLTNSGVNYSKITEIEIEMDARINSTTNITFAGWKIYNWTSNSMVTIANTIFNATSDILDKCYITQDNQSDFINQTYNNRIEIYFVVSTNNSNSTKAFINFIRFNLTYPINKTGISAEIQLKSISQGNWINRTMEYQKIFENWSFSWTFSSQNSSGIWRIYFNLTDKDGHWIVYDTNRNITVKNHQPYLINWTKSTNSIYRNQFMSFYANATDMDVYNRSTDLIVTVHLYHELSNIWYNISNQMDFNSTSDSWYLNWSVPNSISFVLGNYTYMLKVTDLAGGEDFINTHLNITILNNIPTIQVVKFIPADFKLFDGEVIEIWGNFSDVEYINYSVFQLNDSSGGIIQRKIYYPYQASNSSDFHEQFTRNEYSRLKYQGTWDLHVFIYDGDGDYSQITYSISLKMPPFLPPPPPFPWEYLIIAGLIVSVVLGTILVYRFYHREQIVIPASRVKVIIKKMMKEREKAEIEEQKLIEERLKKEKLKKTVKPSKKEKPPSKEKLPSKKEKLDKLEIRNLEVRISETLNSARQAVRKKNFSYAAELYQRAAKLSSKLGNIDKAKKFSERAEEYYKKSKK